MLIQYEKSIEGSYAPVVQRPGSESYSQLTLQQGLIAELNTLWDMLMSLHLLILEPPKTLWNIRVGIAVAVMREEYALVSLLAHIIKVYKHARSWAENNGRVAGFSKFVEDLIEGFSAKYTVAIKFFNSLRLMPELCENKSVVTLPYGLDMYLREIVPRGKVSDRKGVVALLQHYNSIMGLRVPRCINNTAIPASDEAKSTLAFYYENDPNARPPPEEKKEEPRPSTISPSDSRVFREAPNQFCYTSRQNSAIGRMGAFIPGEDSKAPPPVVTVPPVQPQAAVPASTLRPPQPLGQSRGKSVGRIAAPPRSTQYSSPVAKSCCIGPKP